MGALIVVTSDCGAIFPFSNSYYIRNHHRAVMYDLVKHTVQYIGRTIHDRVKMSKI